MEKTGDKQSAKNITLWENDGERVQLMSPGCKACFQTIRFCPQHR